VQEKKAMVVVLVLREGGRVAGGSTQQGLSPVRILSRRSHYEISAAAAAKSAEMNIVLSTAESEK
jgi:hypothetical protein